MGGAAELADAAELVDVAELADAADAADAAGASSSDSTVVMDQDLYAGELAGALGMLPVQRAEQTSRAQMLSVSQHAILEPQQLMRLAQHVMLQRQLLQHLFALLHAYTEDLLREASQLANHEERAAALSVVTTSGV